MLLENQLTLIRRKFEYSFPKVFSGCDCNFFKSTVLELIRGLSLWNLKKRSDIIQGRSFHSKLHKNFHSFFINSHLFVYFLEGIKPRSFSIYSNHVYKINHKFTFCPFLKLKVTLMDQPPRAGFFRAK